MKQLTATIIAALFCAACGTTQLKNSPALELSDVDSIHIMPGTPHLIRADNAKIISTAELLNMVGQVDYLKLDSSEPIGEISKMVVTRDKIFILDAHIAQQIFVFNKTGKLLFRLSQKWGFTPTYSLYLLSRVKNTWVPVAIKSVPLLV